MTTQLTQIPAQSGTSSPAIYKDIQQYYDVAGPDYQSWSRHFNMHFGYYRKWTDIFSLEKMLNNMNDEVIKKLVLDPRKEALVADLGCGMGTVARFAVTKYPHIVVKGVTISDWQVKKGTELSAAAGLASKVQILKENFEHLRFADESFTHVYAIESACHAASDQKELFIAEMARILKEGGRFCIADGFIKNNGKKPRLFRWLYKRIAGYWAVPGFACVYDFVNMLKEYGLKDIEVKEISYRIAPSVLYVPLVCIKFFVKEILHNHSLKMKKERWNNVYAPLLGMIMGMFRKHFGYYMISGRKGSSE